MNWKIVLFIVILWLIIHYDACYGDNNMNACCEAVMMTDVDTPTEE